MRFVKRGSSTSSSGRRGRHVRPRFLAPRGLIGRTGIAALLLFGGLVGFLLLPAFAATTWTVCSSGCNFTTIQEAITASSAGDTISVLAGTYVEDLTINKQLTLSGPHAGSAAGDVVNGAVITRIDEAIVQGATNAGVSVTATGVVIDGLKFIRPSGAGSGATAYVRLVSAMTAGIHTTVKNSVFDLAVSEATKGCGSAISGGNGAVGDVAVRFTIENNAFIGHSGSSCSTAYAAARVVYITSGSASDSADTVIRHNLFKNVAAAIFVEGPSPNIAIQDNWFDTGGEGVTLGTVQDPLIQGNTFADAGRAGGGSSIYLDGSVRTQVLDNTFDAIVSTNPHIWVLGNASSTLISGNTFNESTYWAILLQASSGARIINNRFESGTLGALSSCNAVGTIFNSNYVASVGKPISGGSYAARIGVGTCSGQALDARLNYWAPGAAVDRIWTVAPSTSTILPITYSFTLPGVARTPGFWPATTTSVAPVAPVPDAPVVETPVVLADGSTTSLQLDFGEITAGGNLTVTTAETPADGTFSLGGNPVISITFDGTFTPPVKVCLTYSDTSFAPGATPQLFHYTGGVWSALPTVSLDPVGKVICANTDSFSEFGVGVVIPPDPEIDAPGPGGGAGGAGRPAARHIHRHFHPKAWCWHRHAHERIFEQHRKGARHLMLRRHLDEHPEHAHKPRRCPSGFHHR